MAEKILNTRILLKIDTLENWNASTLPLKKGELAIATVAATAGSGLAEPVTMIKIGEDGVKTFKDLEWNFYAKASDVLAAAKSEAKLTEFVNGVIKNSGLATDGAMKELAADVEAAEGKIATLEGTVGNAEGGLVKGVADNAAAIAGVKGLVGDTAVATQIQNAIAELKLGETYAAKSLEKTVSDHVADTVAHVTTADKTKWNAALQASDIAAGSANGTVAVKGTDVAVTGLGSAAFTEASAYEVSGAAAQALTDAKAYAKEYADGLAKNYDAAGSAATAESNAKAYAKEYADGLAGNYDASGAAAGALTEAKGYTDAEIAEWVGDKNVQAQIADLKLAETYAPISHKHTKADITDFAHTHEMGEVNGLADALAGKETAGAAADALAEAIEYADGKDAAIEAAQAAADKAQEEVDDLEGVVGALPEGEESVIKYIEKKTAGIATDAALGELQAAVDAIEADYLKAADKTELAEDIADLAELIGDGGTVPAQIEAAVAAEKQRAEGIEGGLRTDVNAIKEDYLKAADKQELQDQIDLIMDNPDTKDVIDSIAEFTQYITEHGTIADGFRTDIDANADAIEAIEADYLKNADKEALQGGIDGVAGRMTTAEGKITALEGASATHATKSEVEAVAGRVTTVEGKVTTLEGEMDAVEGRAAALETKVGDKTVQEQISAAINALKIGDYAKAADLTAAITQHNTDKAALEASIAKKANDADLAAVAKSGLIDDLSIGEGTVLVFDCGNATV